MEESSNINGNNNNSSANYSTKEKNEAFKDVFYSTDLEQYFKKGSLPLVFITHALSAILITYIIIAEQKILFKLQQETRLLQESFYFNIEDIQEPSRDFRRTFYFNTINDLLEHTDNVIMKLFTINDTIPYTINWLNKDFKLSFTHKKGIINPIYKLDIRHKEDNPLRAMTHEELRSLIFQLKQMSIDAQYQTQRLSCNVCQLIKITLNYDFSRIGFVEFNPLFTYTNCNSNLFNSESIQNGFTKSNSIICLVIIIMTMIECYTIIMKIGSLISIVYCIKQNVLSVNHFSLFIGENSLLYSGKTPWDLITKKDIFSLFSKWLLFILCGNICQLASCVFYILTPLFNNYNQILFGVSAAFSWFSLAYYFQRHKSYYCFYQTLKKSMKVCKNLFVTFTLLFAGFVLFHLTIFTSNEKWYNGFHRSFLTLFAAFLGDLLLNIWHSTLETSPLLTMFLSVVLYILFIGCHLRVMFTMTQETFEISNLERKKDWLDNNYSLNDYITNHFDLNEDEEDKDEDDENKNFALSDMWMRAIVNTKDMNNLLHVDFEKLQGKGYNIDSIKKYLLKYQKAELRKQRSQDVFNQIIDSNFDGKYANDNKFREQETIALGSKNKEIENIFSNLHLLFEELGSKVIPIKSTGILLINNTRILSTCIKAINRLERIKKDL